MPIPTDEKEREKLRKQLREVSDKILDEVKDFIDNAVFLCETERLGDLAHAINLVTSYELVKAIRDKGFSKELTKLCDKVGQSDAVNQT